jgi:hypothetical protein
VVTTVPFLPSLTVVLSVVVTSVCGSSVPAELLEDISVVCIGTTVGLCVSDSFSVCVVWNGLVVTEISVVVAGLSVAGETTVGYNELDLTVVIGLTVKIFVLGTISADEDSVAVATSGGSTVGSSGIVTSIASSGVVVLMEDGVVKALGVSAVCVVNSELYVYLGSVICLTFSVEEIFGNNVKETEGIFEEGATGSVM